MAVKWRRFGTLGFVLLAIALGGCAHRLHNDAPTDWDRTYTAIVETKAGVGATPDPVKDRQRLAAYYAAMQDIAGAIDLSEQYIGCVGCDLVSGTAPLDRLTFFFYREHVRTMHAFTRAMTRVQSSSLANPDFTFKIDTVPAPPAHDCPSTCKYKTVCYRQCDGDGSTPKCDVCPMP